MNDMSNKALLTASTADAGLSRREFQVLVGISRGLTNAEIATKLEMSAHTVKGLVQQLSAKLGARSRAHAVAIGYEIGVLQKAEGCGDGDR